MLKSKDSALLCLLNSGNPQSVKANVVNLELCKIGTKNYDESCEFVGEIHLHRLI